MGAVFGHDILVSALSFPLAWVLRDGASVLAEDYLLESAFIFATIAGSCFIVLGLHRGLWRHSSTRDLVAVLRAATISILIFLPVLFMVGRLDDVPRTVPIIQWLLLLVMLGGPRFAYKIWSDRVAMSCHHAHARTPVLVAGVGEATDLLIRAVAADPQGRYQVLGVLDVAGEASGRGILGVPILGGIDDLGAIVRRLSAKGPRPSCLVFAGAADSSLLRRTIGQAEALGLDLARLPDLVDFRAAVDDGRIELRPIPLQELLGRPQVNFDQDAVHALIRGRRILVTGAGGSIGSELTRQLASFQPSHLVYIDQCEFNLYAIEQQLSDRFAGIRSTAVLADVRDRTKIWKIAERYRPDLIFHAAALKHVPMVERNPLEGVHTNALGTRNVAEAAARCGALAMIQISTDKAVNPTSVMGASKRLAELYCQALDNGSVHLTPTGLRGTRTRFMTVRFGNVLGSSGSVVPLFQRQLLRGGPLTVTHPDIRRYFMTVREAVELVLQASACGLEPAAERGQVFVLDMGEPIRIVDLARQMIRLAGKEPDTDIPIVFTGLRPGEKLYEELFDSAELRLPPIASGVLAARTPQIDEQALRQAFDVLAEACARADVVMLHATLQALVPGYRSSDADAQAA